MFFGFLSFLFKSLAILAGALSCSVHLSVIPVLTLIIYYMFELCVVYLFESSLLGSSQLSGCPCLLRPALQPGSTGQLFSCGVLSKHFGPSSRILAGPVSGEIDLCACGLSHFFYHFLSVLFLSFCSSVCSGVLCVGSTLWSSSGTVVSFQVFIPEEHKSSLMKHSKSSLWKRPLEAAQWGLNHWVTNPLLLIYDQTKGYLPSPLHWRQVLFTRDTLSKSSTSETPLEAAQGCTNLWVAHPNPRLLLHDQTEGYHPSPLAKGQTKSSLWKRPLEAAQWGINHWVKNPLLLIYDQTKRCTPNPPLLIYDQTRRYHTSSLTREQSIQGSISEAFKSSLVEPFKSSTLEARVSSLRLSSPLAKRQLCQALTTEATLSISEAFKSSLMKQLKSSTLEATVSDLGLPHPLQPRKISTPSLPSSPDHRRRSLADLATLNRSSGISTMTIQDLDQLKAIPAPTSDEVNLISSRPGDVDKTLSTFNYPANYFLYLEESQASATEDFCQKEEKTAANSSPNGLSATREIGEQLLCSIAIHPGLANCCSKLDAISNNSADNRVSELLDLHSLFTSIRSHWQTSLNSCWRVLTNSTAEVFLIRDSSATHSTSDATSSFSPPTSYYILDHPTFAMPNNSGDLHDWNTFCASCKSTIKDKKELNLIQGLHCLRKAITHPTLSLLLHLPAGTSDFCLEGMAELQEKYSMTQEFYALVCWILNTLPGYKHTRIILSRLVHLLKKTISSLKSTNPCKFDNLLFILVYSLCHSKLQASWAQDTAKETAVPALSQTILPLRHPSETLHASGAPTSVSSSELPPRKSSTKKTDKETPSLSQQKSYACSTSAMLPPHQQKSYACSTSAMPSLSQQKSYDCSTPATSSNFDYVFFKLERHPIHLCSQKQNYTATQERSSLSTSNLCHNSEGATPPVPTTSILSQPQQLPDALLMAEEVLLQAPGDQQLETRAFSTQDAGLSPSPAGSQVDRQQSSQFSQSNLPCPLSTYRQQTILSEEPDCQPPGEDSNQAVLPILDLSQQHWKMSQSDNLSCRDAHLCLSSTSTTPTGPVSSSPEPQDISDSALQNCGAVLHPDPLTSKENPTPAFLAIDILALSSCSTPPTAEQPTLCVSTEIVPETLLPSAVWKEEPLHHTADKQPPQKELLEPTDSTTSKQLPQKELLDHSHLVESSTSLSPMAVDLGNLLLIHSYVSSHTDWCWEFCSPLTYKGALLTAATNCVPLVISNHQTPADSSIPPLPEAEKKSAELWLLDQAKLHSIQWEKLSVNIQRRLLSNSSRLKPWTHILIYDQTFPAGNLPAHYCASAWITLCHLTLCPCGSILSCTTGLNLMLLSDRCLNSIAYSSSHWKLQHYLQHLHTAGYSTYSSHQLASATCHSSDPRVHPQLLQYPSTELPPQPCCSWPDSKPNPDSTSEALILYYNPEEAPPGRWRSVSTEDILAHCSSRSKWLLYVSLTHEHYLLPILTLQPSRTAPILTLQPSTTAPTLTLQSSMSAPLNTLQPSITALPNTLQPSKTATLFTTAALQDCHSPSIAALQDCHVQLDLSRFHLSADSCHSGSRPHFHLQLMLFQNSCLFHLRTLSSSSYKGRLYTLRGLHPLPPGVCPGKKDLLPGQPRQAAASLQLTPGATAL